MLLGSTAVAAAPHPGLPTTEPSPSFRELLSLRRVVDAQVAPDGSRIAYVVAIPDWERNGRRLDLWIAAPGETPQPLAAAADFSGNYRWLQDSSALAIMQREEGDSYIQTVDLDDTPGPRIGPLPPGTVQFELAPTGGHIAVMAREPQDDRSARIQEMYGPFEIKDAGQRVSSLWLLDPAETPLQAERLTGADIHVTGIAWAPGGSAIAITHQPDARPNSSFDVDISILDLESRTSRLLAAEAGVDTAQVFSPSGSEVAYLSARGAGISNLPLELMIVPAGGGRARMVTAQVDTAPRNVEWSAAGISFAAEEEALIGLYRLDPDSGEIDRVDGVAEIVRGVSTSMDGDTVALIGASGTTLPEVYRLERNTGVPARLTDLTEQVAGWPLGDTELITWYAADGTPIEGVLTKPADFDPERRYPLLVVVHGGPRAASRPSVAPGFVYPIVQWVARGAMVLQPNYRGSTGYGPEFRSKHHRTLGGGDARDVEAGAEHLVAAGLADPDRIGLMGWSYGGFISAYLSATSEVFTAISVGAGISDWRSHYAWEPVNVTTRDFSFGATPWEDPSAYEVASPVAHIRGASTPTLIQHVDGDPIVPVINAYELYQALKDVGVEARFVEYHGPGHGVSGLRQVHGALWHNWQWFAWHLWGETLEMPTE